MWTIHCNVDLQSPSLIRLFMTPMDCIMPGFPVPYHLLELAHIYVHWVGDAFQPSQPLSPSSASTFNLSPASWSFPMSQLFILGSQSVRASASASVLPINIQDWSPLGWTGWISQQSKGLSRGPGTIPTVTVGRLCYNCYYNLVSMLQTVFYKALHGC